MMAIPISNKSGKSYTQRLRDSLLQRGGLPSIALRHSRPERQRIRLPLSSDHKHKLSFHIIDKGSVHVSYDSRYNLKGDVKCLGYGTSASTAVTKDPGRTTNVDVGVLQGRPAHNKLQFYSYPRHFENIGIPSKKRKELFPALNIEGRNITKRLVSTRNNMLCDNNQTTSYKLAISRKDIPCVSSTIRQKNKNCLERHVSLPLFNISLINKGETDLDIEKISSARHDLETLLKNNGKNSAVNSDCVDSIENQYNNDTVDIDRFIQDMKGPSLTNNGVLKDNVPVTHKINSLRSQSSTLDHVRISSFVPTRVMCKSAPIGMNSLKFSPKLKYSHRGKRDIKTERIKEIQTHNASTIVCKSLEVAGTNDHKKAHWPTYYDVNTSYDQSHKYVFSSGTPSVKEKSNTHDTPRYSLRGGKLSNTFSRSGRGIGNTYKAAKKEVNDSVKKLKGECLNVDTDKPNRRLEPIIVPSHTETFCPMCRSHFENDLDYCVSCCGSESDVSEDDSLGEEVDIEFDGVKSDEKKIEDGYQACCSSPVDDESLLHIQGIALH